jgi:Protein of unknown function (DUF1573)
MKKTFFLSGLLALGVASAVFAGAILSAFKWVETEHNFGQIAKGKPVTAEFKFTNTGNEVLIISNARGSCGCTGVEYPKEPVMPGATGIIKATFNAAYVGAFNKSVTVESNAEGGTTTLQIRGEVVE